MLFYESPSTDPYTNLAAEEVLFTLVPPKQRLLMLWQNRDCVVVGKYQNTVEEINVRYVSEHDLPVVRRLSGGGAVYHDEGNLNYTLIQDLSPGETPDFRPFAAPVIRALARLGVTAEFTGRNDVAVDGRKISGGAQYVKNGRVLHHGCILLNADADKIAAALRVSEAKFRSHGVRSVTSRVAGINAYAPRPIPMEELRQTLREEFLASEECRPFALSPEAEREIQRLRREKYATRKWNYGFGGAYSVTKERRFPAALLRAEYDAEENAIAALRFSGDFFGEGEIAELEEKLRGRPLDESLLPALEEMNVGYYIRGVTPRELYELIIY